MAIPPRYQSSGYQMSAQESGATPLLLECLHFVPYIECTPGVIVAAESLAYCLWQPVA
jgi:hypothetical protein